MAVDWSGHADSLAEFEDATVSLVSVLDAGNVTTSGIPADLGKVSWKVMQAVMAAGYVRPEVMCTVRKSQAAGPWKPGDLLVDSTVSDATGPTGSGITYTIQYVDGDDASWLFAAMNPKVTYGLRHTVDIYHNVVGLDSALSIVQSSQGLAYSSVPARVQPVTNSFQEYEGRQGTFREYVVELYPYPFKVDLTHNHILVWRDPESDTVRVLDVKSWDSAQQIDRLMEVKAELRP